jgi:release factor glutamine methyltransferase
MDTLHQLYQHMKEQLRGITDSPAQASLEATLLLEGVLGIEAAAIYQDGAMGIPDDKATVLRVMLRERLERRLPVQYLLHQAWFYGLSFYVNPHVLIPRPETEHLVEAVLACVTPSTLAKQNKILDVGTGSGAIAIALSFHLKEDAAVSAVDVSGEALAVARFNQRRLGSAVHFYPPGDLFAPLHGTGGGEVGHRKGKSARRSKDDSRKPVFDVIVSNPPYVDPALRPTMAPEVLWHEPSSALFPPADNIDYFYRRLAAEGRDYLAPGGTLIVEAGAGMAEGIRAIFAENGFVSVRGVPDYAGIERVVIGVWPTFSQSEHS